MHSIDLRCELLAGADLSMANCHSCTALHYAVMRGDVTVVAYVLDYMAMQADADLNAVDKHGQTALTLAVCYVTESQYRVPSSVSILLIEAGQTFRLCQMHRLETCALQVQTSRLQTQMVKQHYTMQHDEETQQSSSASYITAHCWTYAIQCYLHL